MPTLKDLERWAQESDARWHKHFDTCNRCLNESWRTCETEERLNRACVADEERLSEAYKSGLTA